MKHLTILSLAILALFALCEGYFASPATGALPRADYLDLAIEYRGDINAPHFRNELAPQVNGIYQILGTMLGQQNLRQLKLNIALYADRDSYLHYANSIAGRDMSKSGGFYRRTTKEAVTYLHDSPGKTLELAKHESTHVIVTGVLGVSPKWLNEGLAEYFAALSVAGTNKNVSEKPAWMARARSSVKQGYPRDLENLLLLNDTDWRGSRKHDHYALSWALVYFLMSSSDGKSALADLLKQLAGNSHTRFDSVALLASSYRGGLSQMQRDFYDWLADEQAKAPHVY